MNLTEYLDNLRAAQAARQAAMRKIRAALEELTEADTLLDQTLAMRLSGGHTGEMGFFDDMVSDLLEGLPKEVSHLFKFGDLF